MQMFSKFIKGIKTFNLIQDGDSVAIGLSGGKDSLTLVNLFSNLQKTNIVKCKVCAIMIDMFDGKYDFKPIQIFCEQKNIELKIIRTQIFDILFNIRKEAHPCSLCSKMRKGQLISTAKQLGCNKVALGHHADDFIETFIMSLMFEGRLSTFSPLSYLSREGIYQIRPMIYIAEDDIIKYSKSFPIFTNPCPADKHTKRQEVKNAIKDIEKIAPDFRKNTLRALLDPARHQNFFAHQ